MHIVQSKSNIVEKVLRDKEGRLVRARFQVYEIAGRVKARLVDVRYIDVRNFLEKAVHVLSGFVQTTTHSTQTYFNTYTSPFLSLTSIFYSGTKARAPTF